MCTWIVPCVLQLEMLISINVLVIWIILECYDHQPLTIDFFFFMAGALLVSVLASPTILVMSFLHLPKTYGLIAGWCMECLGTFMKSVFGVVK